MAGLQTIHLHNSFYRGSRIRIDCDGHTALFGANGAGKTTMLNLVPVFIGFEPSRLMVRAADKASFADWYLPDVQSMIVFEYTRTTGETCCAIFFRRDSGTDSKHAIRFVAGAAEDTIFHPALKDLHDSGVSANIIIREHLSSKLGVACSKIVASMVEYRAIMQNDLKVGSPSDLRAIARQFSVTTNSKMQHIELLVAVSLHGKEKIGALKDMVVDSMLKPTLALASAQSHEKNIHIWSDTRSLSAFAIHEQKAIRALSEYATIQDNRIDLITNKRELAKLMQLGEAQTIQLQKQIKHTDALIIDKEGDHKVSYLGMVSNETACNSQAKQIEMQINSLNLQYEDFENEQNMPHWVSEADKEAFYRSELLTAQDWLTLCEASNAERTKVADQLKRDAERVRDSEVEEIDKNKSSHEASLELLSAEFKIEVGALRDTHDAELKAMATRHSENTQERDSSIRFAYTSMAAQSDLTDDEEARKADAEQKKSASSKELEIARKAEKTVKENLVAAERANNEAERKYSAGNTALTNATIARNEIYALLTPTDGSLLAFLRNSGSEWEQSLGKTINPELLKRKDLQPKLTGNISAGANLFGLEIDLDQLELPEQAESQEALTERAQKADRHINVLKDALDSLETKWKATQKIKSTLESEYALAEQAVIKRIKLASEAEGELKAISEAIAHAIKLRRDECLKLINELEKQKADALANESKETEDLRANQKGVLAAAEALNDAQTQELKLLIEKLEDARRAAKKVAAEKIRSYNEALSRELSEQGFDEQTINQKRIYISELTTKISAIQSRYINIHSYKEWLNREWPKRFTLAQEQSAKEAQARAIKDDILAAQTKHKGDIDTLKEKVRTTTQEATTLQRKYEQWVGAEKAAKELIDKIPLPSKAPASERQDRAVSLDIESLIVNNINSLSDQTSRLIDRVVSVLSDSVCAINENPDSTLYAKWQNLYDTRRKTTQRQPNTISFQLEQMEDLKTTIEHEVPEIRKVLSESIKSVARLMGNHYSSLCEINKKVGDISRRLETKLNTEHDFEELTNIQISLVSRVTELEYWQQLKSFIREWNEWFLTHNQELPTESLLLGFESLNDAFKKARLVESDISSLVHLEISMTENGRPVSVRTDHDLNNASSTGLTAIATFIIFAALTRYLCPDDTVNITWPIDELGKIDTSNVARLLEMLNKKNITMISAQPENSNPETSKLYKHSYTLVKGLGAQVHVSAQRKRGNPWSEKPEQEHSGVTQEVASNA